MPSATKHRQKLGESIRNYRKKVGLSQEALAEKAELSTVFISEIECGKKSISIDSLVRVSRALGVRVKDIVANL